MAIRRRRRRGRADLAAPPGNAVGSRPLHAEIPRFWRPASGLIPRRIPALTNAPSDLIRAGNRGGGVLHMRSRRRWLVGVSVCALVWSGGATRPLRRTSAGIDPNQGESLVEVNLPEQGARRCACSSRPRRTASTSTSTTCASEPDGSVHRDRVRHRRRDRGARRRRLRGRRRRSRARARGATGSRRARPTSARRTAPTTPRSTSRSSRRARTRTSSSSCASTTSRTTPAASCRSRRRRGWRRSTTGAGATYTGPTLSLSWNTGRGRRSTRRRGR